MVDTGEACDDANADDTDNCLTTCVAASCGDGFVRESVEACDDGSASNSDTDPDACRATCELPVCGDGVVDSGEECDGGANCDAECNDRDTGDPDLVDTKASDSGCCATYGGRSDAPFLLLLLGVIVMIRRRRLSQPS